jgi:hypothetical protein
MGKLRWSRENRIAAGRLCDCIRIAVSVCKRATPQPTWRGLGSEYFQNFELEFEAKAEELQIAHAAANVAPTGGLLVCDHDLYIEEQSYIVAYGKFWEKACT